MTISSVVDLLSTLIDNRDKLSLGPLEVKQHSLQHRNKQDERVAEVLGKRYSERQLEEGECWAFPLLLDRKPTGYQLAISSSYDVVELIPTNFDGGIGVRLHKSYVSPKNGLVGLTTPEFKAFHLSREEGLRLYHFTDKNFQDLPPMPTPTYDGEKTIPEGMNDRIPVLVDTLYSLFRQYDDSKARASNRVEGPGTLVRLSRGPIDEAVVPILNDLKTAITKRSFQPLPVESEFEARRRFTFSENGNTYNMWVRQGRYSGIGSIAISRVAPTVDKLAVFIDVNKAQLGNDSLSVLLETVNDPLFDNSSQDKQKLPLSGKRVEEDLRKGLQDFVISGKWPGEGSQASSAPTGLGATLGPAVPTAAVVIERSPSESGLLDQGAVGDRGDRAATAPGEGPGTVVIDDPLNQGDGRQKLADPALVEPPGGDVLDFQLAAPGGTGSGPTVASPLGAEDTGPPTLTGLRLLLEDLKAGRIGFGNPELIPGGMRLFWYPLLKDGRPIATRIRITEEGGILAKTLFTLYPKGNFEDPAIQLRFNPFKLEVVPGSHLTPTLEGIRESLSAIGEMNPLDLLELVRLLNVARLDGSL